MPPKRCGRKASAPKKKNKSPPPTPPQEIEPIIETTQQITPPKVLNTSSNNKKDRVPTFPFSESQQIQIFQWFEQHPELWNKCHQGFANKHKNSVFKEEALNHCYEGTVCTGQFFIFILIKFNNSPFFSYNYFQNSVDI